MKKIILYVLLIMATIMASKLIGTITGIDHTKMRIPLSASLIYNIGFGTIGMGVLVVIRWINQK